MGVFFTLMHFLTTYFSLRYISMCSAKHSGAVALKARTVVRERHARRARQGVRSLLFKVSQVVRQRRFKGETVGVVGCKFTTLSQGKNLRVHGG